MASGGTDWQEVRAYDRALVAACLDGDEVAWSALWTRYGPLVKAVARRSGCTDEEARDVLQRVGLVAVRSLGSLRDPDRLGGWLAATARRQALAALRERRAHAAVEDSLVASDTDADEILIRAERLVQLRQAFVRLDPRCQRFLERLELAEPRQSYEAVAESEGLATSSVGPIRRRCLRRLRELLEQVSRSRPGTHCTGGG